MSFPYDQLQSLLAEVRHQRGEPARKTTESAWRRHHDARLDALRERFDTLVERWLPDEGERAAWLAALHDDGPVPTVPESALPPVFKARTSAGALVLVRPLPDDPDFAYELVVDGNLVERMPEPVSGIAGTRWHATHQPVLDELVECPAEALDALADYRLDPAGGPPWRWAVELYREGLVDSNFGLTQRGRRLLEQARRAA